MAANVMNSPDFINLYFVRWLFGSCGSSNHAQDSFWCKLIDDIFYVEFYFKEFQ